MLFDNSAELTKLTEAYLQCVNETAPTDLFSNGDIKEFSKLFGIDFKRADIPEDLFTALADKPEKFLKKTSKLSQESKQLLCNIWIGCQEIALAKFLKDNGIDIKPKEIHEENDVYSFTQPSPGKIKFTITFTKDLIDSLGGPEETDESIIVDVDTLINAIINEDEEAIDEIGGALASIGKAVGKGAKKVGKALGKGAKKVGKAALQKGKEVAKTAGKAALQKGKEVAKATGKASVKGGKAAAKAAGKAAVKGGKALGKAAVKGVKNAIDATGLTSYDISDKHKDILIKNIDLQKVLPDTYTKSKELEYSRNKNSFLAYVAKVVLASTIKPTNAINGGALIGKYKIYKRKGLPVMEGEIQFK